MIRNFDSKYPHINQKNNLHTSNVLNILLQKRMVPHYRVFVDFLPTLSEKIFLHLFILRYLLLMPDKGDKKVPYLLLFNYAYEYTCLFLRGGGGQKKKLR